ncbi:MAG: sialate O-acetylesterase [Planctomycetota bacterium]
MSALPRPLLACLLASFLLGGALTAQSPRLALDPLLGDHMVLQRQAEAVVSGAADADAAVVVEASWLDAPLTGRADAKGRFRIAVPTGPAGGPHSLVVRAGDATITLRDVVVGEVWLASGQSNMEWPVKACGPEADAAREMERAAADERPALVRVFDVAHRAAARPEDGVTGRWIDPGPDEVGDVSAVAYFFARERARALGIPIGILGSNWGGTPAHAWTSAAALREHGGFDEALDRIDREREDFDESPAGFAARREAYRNALRERDPGYRENWSAPDADLGAWHERADASTWTEDPLANFDGSVWFRVRFRATAEEAARAEAIELGPVDDQDEVWIGGRRLGGDSGQGSWNRPRRYPIPAGTLVAGENVLVLRVLDTGGAGGIAGPATANRIVLRPEGDARTAIPLEGPWHYRIGMKLSDAPPAPRRELCGPWDPSALYRGMIAPLRDVALAGALWYQGESDVGRAERYDTLFPAMIRDWRRTFGRPALPFLFVQIAPFEYGPRGDSARLREAQGRALELPATGMAVILDLGDAKDIHPRRKREVGRRLALLARGIVDGEDRAATESPRVASAERDGASLALRFGADGPAIELRGAGGFELAGADGVFHPAAATITGPRALRLRSEAVSEPRRARYAWSNVPESTLFGANGLPASSFRVAVAGN